MSGRKRLLRSPLYIGCLAVVSALGLALLTLLYAFRVEPHWLQVTHVDIWLPALPQALDGLTIVQISDLHVGPYVRAEDLRPAVQAANRLSPDVIVITGDLVSHSASYSVACARELTALRSRYGIYAVLGNHDIWTGADEVARNLRGAGITVLRDEKQPLLIGEIRLWLVGIEDAGFTDVASNSCDKFRTMWTEKYKAAISLLRSIPEAEPRILLVHHPDFNELLAGEHIDLALSGHTHGGQVRLPFLGSPFVPSCLGQKYARGLVQGPASPVYVNRGVRVTAPPARFGCRPEITLLRLRRG